MPLIVHGYQVGTVIHKLYCLEAALVDQQPSPWQFLYLLHYFKDLYLGVFKQAKKDPRLDLFRAFIKA